MKTSNWILIAVAAAVLAGGSLATPSLAADAGSRPAAARRHFLKEQLGLTDEQAAQIKNVLKADRTALTDLLTRIHEARSGLRDAIHSPSATEASVRAASAKVAAAEADMAVERLKLYGKIGPILTAEQRDKLSALRTRLDEFADRRIGRLNGWLSE